MRAGAELTHADPRLRALSLSCARAGGRSWPTKWGWASPCRRLVPHSASMVGLCFSVASRCRTLASCSALAYYPLLMPVMVCLGAKTWRESFGAPLLIVCLWSAFACRHRLATAYRLPCKLPPGECCLYRRMPFHGRNCLYHREPALIILTASIVVCLP